MPLRSKLESEISLGFLKHSFFCGGGQDQKFSELEFESIYRFNHYYIFTPGSQRF